MKMPLLNNLFWSGNARAQNLHGKRIYIILENFCLCLIQKALGESPNFEVMIWQPHHLLHFALNCIQITLFRYKGCHFYRIPNKIIYLYG